MNARQAIATFVALAAIPFVPGCTVTTTGHAEANMSDLADVIDERIDAVIEAEHAERPTVTPQFPAEYAALVDEIRLATAKLKTFWHRQQINLSAVDITMVTEKSSATCRSNDVTDAWTCPPTGITMYLPLLRPRFELGGDGYAWFVVGHELGHYVDNRRAIPSPAMYAESLADCLSGAAAAGVGMADEVLRATDAVFPTSTKRRNAVTFGIERGYQACIETAK